jgi:hypothetical protein
MHRLPKRYAIVARSYFHPRKGHSYHTVRVFDFAEGREYITPIEHGSLTLSTIYVHAERLVGHPIETCEAFVDSVEVTARKHLHHSPA